MAEAYYKWLVLFGCWLLYFAFGLAVSGLAPLVSSIATDLQIGSSKMGAILGAWQFVYIFLAVPVGISLQRIGPGRMLLLAAILIAASSFLRSIATAYDQMLFAVALFGLGGPIISAGIPQMTSRWFKGRQRGLAMGICITGPAIAGVTALSLTNAVLIPWLESWREILRLWAWCAVGAGLAWLTIWLIGRRISFPETASGAESWTGAFREIKRMLRNGNVQILLMLAIGIFTIEHGLRNWMPEIVRSHGWTAVHAGYLAAVPVVMGVVGALIFPARATPKRRVGVLQLLFAMSATGCLLLQIPFAAAQLLALIMIGLASGSMMTVTFLTLIEQEEVSPERAGLAGGLFFAFAEIGGVSGPVVIGVLHDLTHTFAAALLVFSAIGGVLILSSTRLHRPPVRISVES